MELNKKVKIVIVACVILLIAAVTIDPSAASDYCGRLWQETGELCRMK